MMIKGLKKSPLKIISMENGDVMHGMKKNDEGFVDFGEAYFSKINPGAIKAWKKHRKMVCNFIVPNGKVRVVIFDEQECKFEEIILSTENYFRLTIPPNLWVGFQGICRQPSLLLNIGNIVHDPNEVEKKSINKIAYDWSVKK